MYKIEHVGIAVRDLETSTAVYEQLLGVLSYKTETVESEGVVTKFYQVGESKIELLQAMSEQSPIHTFIEKRGEGMHHIAFAVTDIRREMSRLKQLGFQLLSEEPKRGADNKLICFVHPRSANGVLIELCEDIGPAGVEIGNTKEVG